MFLSLFVFCDFFFSSLEDTPSQPQIIVVPVPVPVFVPIPLHLYTQYAPVPFGIPVPVSNHLEIKADVVRIFLN